MITVLGSIHLYKTFFVTNHGFVKRQEIRWILRWAHHVIISNGELDIVGGYDLDDAYKEYKQDNHKHAYLSTEVVVTE